MAVGPPGSDLVFHSIRWMGCLDVYVSQIWGNEVKGGEGVDFEVERA